ncbi:hypothetical protein EKK58_05570 [Candidatus Dependentiae bacterium]|nr:MAG: hypothetical protein EKK58_05570 [Candidatus Dependentiae bacterium]
MQPAWNKPLSKKDLRVKYETAAALFCGTDMARKLFCVSSFATAVDALVEKDATQQRAALMTAERSESFANLLARAVGGTGLLPASLRIELFELVVAG